jgi:predicted secreted hydrolase
MADRNGTPAALQLTILRLGVGDAPDIASGWAAEDVFAAVAILADGSAAGVQVAERISRAAAGLAGSSREPIAIWVEDWRLEPSVPQAGTIALDGRIEIAGKPVALELASGIPAVTPADIAGEAGVPEGPFAYYTQPKLEGVATIGETGDARAEFILEHAWGELPLPGSPVANDRFTLFLDDGGQLILVRTHRTDGSGTPETQGLYVAGDGETKPLDAEAIELEATDYWQSPRTEVRYPLDWRLRIPSLDIDLSLEALRQDSEGVAWAPFWMGPIDLLSSSRSASQLSGVGTMTLNGYGANQN